MHYSGQLVSLLAFTSMILSALQIPGFAREESNPQIRSGVFSAVTQEVENSERYIVSADISINGSTSRKDRQGKRLQKLKSQLNALHQNLAIVRRDRNELELAHTLAKMGEVSYLIGSKYLDIEAGRDVEPSENYLTSYSEAITFKKEALEIYKQAGKYEEATEIIAQIANTYFRMSEYRNSELFLVQQIDEFQATNNQKALKVLHGYMRSYLNHSWYFSAANGVAADYRLLRLRNFSWEESLAISQFNLFVYQESDFEHDDFIRRNDCHSLSSILHGIGWSYYNLGDYKNAIDFLDRAIALEEQENGYAGQLLVVDLATVYIGLGAYDIALEKLQSAVGLQQDICLCNVLSKIGFVYKEMGNYSEALDYLEQALEISSGDSDKHNVLAYLADLYVLMSEYEKAILYYEEAIQIIPHGEQSAEGFILNGLARAYEDSGNEAKALETYEQALDYFRKIHDKSGESLVLSSIASLWGKMGRPELAIIFYKDSVNVRETIRQELRFLPRELQETYVRTVIDDYRALADLLLQQNRVLEAQRVLDLLKVQELDDALENVQRSSDARAGIEFWQIEEDLLALYEQVVTESDQLTQLQAQDYDSLSSEQRQQLSDLQERYEDVQNRFIAFLDLPEVSALLAQISDQTGEQNLNIEVHHRTLQHNLRALPQETALLYPLILPDRLELVLVTADGPPLRYPIAVTGEELNQAVVAFGQALKSPKSDIEPIAQKLYNWLIAPLEAELAQAGIESIIYAPDGVLRYVPLAALHDGEHYLAERFSLSHITAASLTNFSLAPQQYNQRLLAAACAECDFTITVGNQEFPFEDLPFTEAEVKTLAEQVPNTSVLLNQEFSLPELKNRLGSFSVIHLATHGAVVLNNPAQSFVLLGSGETVNLETIRNSWSLSNVELVVLSACETAVGSTDLGTGVEILGLGYQIQEAGAKSVIASLWKVSDSGTQTLMAAFYDAISQGKTKAEALQLAQLALIGNDESATDGERADVEVTTSRTPASESHGSLSHPYYWAPFILIGNGL